ncbi:MAG: hypothetical protein GXY76_09100 [Chloroflexi bacterium]|nr:hypothetical protein [Chloroflexota bacterium]
MTKPLVALWQRLRAIPRRWLWQGAALGLLLWIIGLPPQPQVWLGPPQAVQTANPKMGVHTRLTDEVEEWKIKRTLEMVREMGAPWIVEYFPWGYYEPRKGSYEWAHPDLVVDHALAQGLTVVARIDFVPEWARPPETTYRYLDEAHYQDYGDFVYAFMEHFRGRVQHVIIWNEPNLSFEWGYRPVDPEGYVRLLRIAYQRAKEANPEAIVLTAGLAPTLAPPGNTWGMDELEYLQRMYDAGAADCFDMLAIHAYGLTFPVDDPPDPAVVNFARASLAREVMVRNGDEGKQAMITEAGWNDHPRWTKAVQPYQRIEYTIGAYEMALRQWDWCAAAAMWAFRYPRPTRTYQDYYTLVTTDFVPKGVYLEAQRYAHGLPAEAAP